MPYKTILFERENGIAILTLNRPEVFNAFDEKMTEEVEKALDEVAKDERIRVLILTGAGRGFCTGADVGRLSQLTTAEAPGPAETHARLSRTTSLPARIRDLPKPVIAAVNGVAAGGGFGLALSCDIRIASEQARFTQVFIKRGLIPDSGSTYLLPRVVGTAKACELMFTGDAIDAREAERIGLVNKVVPPEELMKAAKELAAKIAKGPPIAMQLTKKALYKGVLEPDLAAQSDYELYIQSLCFASEDFKEGVQSFLEKREPRFKGR